MAKRKTKTANLQTAERVVDAELGSLPSQLTLSDRLLVPPWVGPLYCRRSLRDRAFRSRSDRRLCKLRDSYLRRSCFLGVRGLYGMRLELDNKYWTRGQACDLFSNRTEHQPD
jgi:hypothetical protein